MPVTPELVELVEDQRQDSRACADAAMTRQLRDLPGREIGKDGLGLARHLSLSLPISSSMFIAVA